MQHPMCDRWAVDKLGLGNSFWNTYSQCSTSFVSAGRGIVVTAASSVLCLLMTISEPPFASGE